MNLLEIAFYILLALLALNVFIYLLRLQVLFFVQNPRPILEFLFSFHFDCWEAIITGKIDRFEPETEAEFLGLRRNLFFSIVALFAVVAVAEVFSRFSN